MERKQTEPQTRLWTGRHLTIFDRPFWPADEARRQYINWSRGDVVVVSSFTHLACLFLDNMPKVVGHKHRTVEGFGDRLMTTRVGIMLGAHNDGSASWGDGFDVVALGLDVDDEVDGRPIPPIEWFEDEQNWPFASLVHTSSGSRPGRWRYHCIVEVDRPIRSKAELRHVGQEVKKWLPWTSDAALTPNRVWTKPSLADSYLVLDYQNERIDGTWQSRLRRPLPVKEWCRALQRQEKTSARTHKRPVVTIRGLDEAARQMFLADVEKAVRTVLAQFAATPVGAHRRHRAALVMGHRLGEIFTALLVLGVKMEGDHLEWRDRIMAAAMQQARFYPMGSEREAKIKDTVKAAMDMLVLEREEPSQSVMALFENLRSMCAAGD